jgi:tetraacyldisaccharide 4'-kinase
MQLLRYLLLPVSILYGCVTWLRNLLFDWGIKKEMIIPFPSICVGNLSTGGTGKTPHVLLLNQLLSDDNEIVIVSRGYGRKTKGLLLADENATAETIGDEPMLFHNATPQPTVIVSEKRVLAVEAVKQLNKNNPILLLDDAFQHRHVRAGMNILLCDFNKPYFKDFMLPTGNLREFKSGEKRADLVIVTKCPLELTEMDKAYFRNKINRPNENIYFSTIHYSAWEAFSDVEMPSKVENIVLVTGIANPKPLENHLSKTFSLKSVIFPDHYTFTQTDIKDIHEIFGNFASDKTILLTTEKDAMRLEQFKQSGELNNYPWFVQKMHVQIDRETELKEKLKKYVRKVQ